MAFRQLGLLGVLALCSACSSTSTNTASGGGAGSGATGGSGGGSAVGCADGTVDQTYASSPSMVGCNGNQNQCGAASLCAAGWHLCTYAEYWSRGGASEKATADRWLSSCIRQYESNTATCPDENVCGNACFSTSGAVVAVGFDCDSGAPLDTDQVNQGLIASNALLRPGCPTAECAFVYPITSSAGKGAAENFGATCCQ